MAVISYNAAAAKSGININLYNPGAIVTTVSRNAGGSSKDTDTNALDNNYSAPKKVQASEKKNNNECDKLYHRNALNAYHKCNKSHAIKPITNEITQEAKELSESGNISNDNPEHAALQAAASNGGDNSGSNGQHVNITV